MNNEMTTDNMSNEEVIDVLKGIVFNGFDRTTSKERQALDHAIKVLEKLKNLELKDKLKILGITDKDLLLILLNSVMPPEQKTEMLKNIKRPQGEWIRTGSLGNGNAQYECSICHYGDEQAESQEVPYCWHCGASMQKGGAE